MPQGWAASLISFFILVKLRKIGHLFFLYFNEIPASVELQLGKNFTPALGSYVDALVGVGGDRSYDWGVGAGLRYNY